MIGRTEAYKGKGTENIHQEMVLLNVQLMIDHHQRRKCSCTPNRNRKVILLRKEKAEYAVFNIFIQNTQTHQTKL